MGRGKKDSLTFSQGKGVNWTVCSECGKEIQGRTADFTRRLLTLHLEKIHNTDRNLIKTENRSHGKKYTVKKKYNPKGELNIN